MFVDESAEPYNFQWADLEAIKEINSGINLPLFSQSSASGTCQMCLPLACAAVALSLCLPMCLAVTYRLKTLNFNQGFHKTRKIF